MLNVSCVFLCVGLCSHTDFFCRLRGDMHGVDRVDPSPRDYGFSTCAKAGLSETLHGRHVAGRGSINLQFFVIGGIARSPDLHRTAAIFRDRRHCAIARSSSDGRDLL